MIRDGGDFARHFNYIHYNPVNQDLVADPLDGDGPRCRPLRDATFVGRGWQGATIRTDRSAIDRSSQIAVRSIGFTLAIRGRSR